MFFIRFQRVLMKLAKIFSVYYKLVGARVVGDGDSSLCHTRHVKFSVCFTTVTSPFQDFLFQGRQGLSLLETYLYVLISGKKYLFLFIKYFIVLSLKLNNT